MLRTMVCSYGNGDDASYFGAQSLCHTMRLDRNRTLYLQKDTIWCFQWRNVKRFRYYASSSPVGEDIFSIDVLIANIYQALEGQPADLRLVVGCDWRCECVSMQDADNPWYMGIQCLPARLLWKGEGNSMAICPSTMSLKSSWWKNPSQRLEDSRGTGSCLGDSIW